MKSLFDLIYDDTPKVGEIWTEKSRQHSWYIKRVEEGNVWYTLFPDNTNFETMIYRSLEDFMKAYQFKG